MMNRVVLVGRLTRDPELRYTPAGVAVATFTLAVNRTFTNQQGEREADFINCVVWRKPAENVANFLKKGNLAGVDGRIQTRNYEGQDGKRVYVTEVVAESVQFLEPKNNATSNNNQYGGNQSYSPRNTSQAAQNTSSDPFARNGNPIDISDDDLPF
ncbi:single-stranded DNA-binding protein [Listeria kieliensis]